MVSSVLLTIDVIKSQIHLVRQSLSGRSVFGPITSTLTMAAPSS
jgi:hypothetical protein